MSSTNDDYCDYDEEYYNDDHDEEVDDDDEDDYDEETIGSRVRLMDYMDDDEAEQFGIFGGEVLEFDEGELQSLMKESLGGSESSFNDDGIPASEAEYFSSDFEESDVGDYIPPVTNTKKVLIYRLLQYQINDSSDDDEENEEKQFLRQRAIRDFQNLILKKRAAKAYRRYVKVRDLEMEDVDQEAFLLEKMEIVDKKLQRPFYYEDGEPASYKKLLQKRRKAIKRKYERYALDPEYREELQDIIVSNVGKYLKKEDLERSRIEKLELSRYEDVQLNETLYNTAEDQNLYSMSLSATISDDDEKDDGESDEVVSQCSSFYDDAVPDSEIEFFSSDYDEDCNVSYPGPESTTLDRYRRYIVKCRSTLLDGPEQRMEKNLRRADVEAQFKNFLEGKKALKALARAKIVSSMKLTNRTDEAEQFLHLEIVDKKLHLSFYYDENEPDTYKILLGKRRRALIRKYEKFISEPKYRDEIIRNIYMKVMRMQPSPIFDAGDSEDDETSSFNDSEVPSSEEEFMSKTYVFLPTTYEKPMTRTKATLYEELENYEADGLHDTESMLLEKRKRRLEIIQRHKNRQIDRRKMKALARLEEARRMGINDHGIVASKLMQMELADKKLNRGFYYSPGEPLGFTALMNKRIRAIERKYNAYARDHNFRNEMEFRIMSAVRKPKKEIIPNDKERTWRSIEGPSFGNLTMQGGSMWEGDRKVERKREYAKAGVWPKYRESAPPMLDVAADRNRLSTGYGFADDRTYFKDVGGSPDLSWDDDGLGFGLPTRPPAPDYMPPEEEFFRSLLDVTRHKNREKCVEFAKNAHISAPPKRPTEEIFARQQAEERAKKRTTTTQTYLDFLLHKRNECARTRAQAFREMGYRVPKGATHYSFTEGMQARSSEGRDRRYSFPRDRDESGRYAERSDLSAILKEGDIGWEKRKSIEIPELLSSAPPTSESATRQHYGDLDPALQYIIEDRYYPGLIDDAINGRIDFNRVAFDITFGDEEIPEDEIEPENIPLSLIEAFDIRLERETGAIKKTTMQQPTVAINAEELELAKNAGHEDFTKFLKERSSFTKIINREELVLASTVGIDVSNIVHNKPINELMKAINSLQRAELMNVYDKSAQAAEEAYENAPNGLKESAAVFGARNFHTEEITKKKTTFIDAYSYRPIEIVSYMGITKPMADVSVDKKKKT